MSKKRVSLSLALATVVLALAYLYLFLQTPSTPILRSIVSAAIDPGWRAATLIFPEGVHAGIPFFVLSALVNLALYALVACVLSLALSKRKTERHV